MNSDGKEIPVKVIAEQHIEEDCGYIPTPQDWLRVLFQTPEPWMLRVKVRSRGTFRTAPSEDDHQKAEAKEEACAISQT